MERLEGELAVRVELSGPSLILVRGAGGTHCKSRIIWPIFGYDKRGVIDSSDLRSRMRMGLFEKVFRLPQDRLRSR